MKNKNNLGVSDNREMLISPLFTDRLCSNLVGMFLYHRRNFVFRWKFEFIPLTIFMFVFSPLQKLSDPVYRRAMRSLHRLHKVWTVSTSFATWSIRQSRDHLSYMFEEATRPNRSAFNGLAREIHLSNNNNDCDLDAFLNNSPAT